MTDANSSVRLHALVGVTERVSIASNEIAQRRRTPSKLRALKTLPTPRGLPDRLVLPGLPARFRQVARSTKQLQIVPNRPSPLRPRYTVVAVKLREPAPPWARKYAFASGADVSAVDSAVQAIVLPLPVLWKYSAVRVALR